MDSRYVHPSDTEDPQDECQNDQDGHDDDDDPDQPLNRGVHWKLLNGSAKQRQDREGYDQTYEAHFKLLFLGGIGCRR